MLQWKTKAGKVRTYEPTRKDELWLLRAVASEGRSRHEVAQTLVNRFAYLQAIGYGRDYPTLASLVRAYAQPLSDKWPERGSSAVRARRKAARERSSFNETTRAAVARALARGPVNVPATAVHYAAHNVRRSKLTALTPEKKGRNRLWATKGAAWWPGYSIAEAGDTGGGKVVALVVLGLVWMLARKR